MISITKIPPKTLYHYFPNGFALAYGRTIRAVDKIYFKNDFPPKSPVLIKSNFTHLFCIITFIKIVQIVLAQILNKLTEMFLLTSFTKPAQMVLLCQTKGPPEL